MGVNCKGVFLCSRAAAVNMLRRHSGAIVNVSSMWGRWAPLAKRCIP